MHTLRPATVNRIRAVVVWWLRAVSSLMLLSGALLIIKRLAFGVLTRQLDSAWSIHQGIGEWHEFSLGLALLFMGAVLALLATNLGRWIISLPPEDCPRCLHAGILEGMDRCPECGLAGFGSPTAAPRHTPPPPPPPPPGS